MGKKVYIMLTMVGLTPTPARPTTVDQIKLYTIQVVTIIRGLKRDTFHFVTEIRNLQTYGPFPTISTKQEFPQ